ncbi:dephospho-CoA kinase [Rhizobiales bacterium RZME27]|jgi:dephospho-CoA kinase|uniref:Dephospho-CoA kinase n=1 Tax=Endobacterium cereale TaxID=2663029 RepID=A0A6A8A8P5_9HYPH|nr:dephospho-CoA kinase [Endobacterium cereale]MEB2845239.1 dephospho-CoA kinase [Endobacterium cereale]MQY46020.1 dephospho-CoA kinase [Endobacterium cereale]
MIIIGLTGSIGMGKTTTARFFSEEGIAVNDADAVVHDLYKTDAVEPVGREFPGSVKNGAVDRQELSKQLAEQSDGFKRLEAIVHPLVRERERRFLDRQKQAGADIVVLDIPLLFESGRDDVMDTIVVVTSDPEIQRERVLARPAMTEEKFRLILSRQTPDREKRQKADFLVDTGNGMDPARTRVRAIIKSLRAGILSEKTDA